MTLGVDMAPWRLGRGSTMLAKCLYLLTALLILGRSVGYVSTGVRSNYMRYGDISAGRRFVTANKADFEYESTESRLKGVTLPALNTRERLALAAGERIQKQNRDGRAGYGIVVVDVQASADDVFDELTKFEEYANMIPTVRKADVYSATPKKVVAEFAVSRFALRFNVVHSIMREQRLIKFELDDSRANLVMKKANGFWHVQSPPDRPGYARVWLSAEVVASMLVPTVVVDYAAKRALPRATRWLQPYFLGQKAEY